MFHTPYHHRRLGKLAGFLLLLLIGCGQSGPKVLRVSGTVTRAGKPIPHLMVNFMPESGRPSWGMTDDRGHYSLHYDNTQEGAIAGKHRVFILYRPPQSRDPGQEGRQQKIPAEVTAILAKYGKMDASPLTLEVNKNGQVVDLPLD